MRDEMKLRPRLAGLCLLFAVSGSGLGTIQQESGSLSPANPPKPLWTISASKSDQNVTIVLDACLRAAQARVESFFGHPFKQSFHAEIFPSRSKFDEYFKQRWQLPKTERWMVALGVADKLAILTPRVWPTEATEHDPKDPTHIQELVAHELVHVYHGQHNPSRDFEGMDDLGWFVEGLAVYVSGQLEHGHQKDARKAISTGKAPRPLAKAWSGPYRYGVSGSMVQFIDNRYGRDMLWQLLPETKPERVLNRLKFSENDFLQAWRDCVMKNNKP
jgi:hypothetical protein